MSTEGQYIEFSSIQAAVQACLELVGARSQAVDVVTTVLVSSDVLSGVVRSGAQPVLVDIDPQYRQVSITDFTDVIREVQEPVVVILDRTVNRDINPALQEICTDSNIPSLAINHYAPSSKIVPKFGTYNIYPLQPYLSAGALVVPEHAGDKEALEALRSGPLGLAAALPKEMKYTLGDSIIPTKRDYAVIYKQGVWTRRWSLEPYYPVAEKFEDINA